MGNNRIRQPLRPENDEKQRNRQVALLRRENHQLRREAGRLQKRLARVMDTVSAVESEAEPEPMSTPAPIGCLECGGNLTHVTLPFGVLIACKCGYRKVEKICKKTSE